MGIEEFTADVEALPAEPPLHFYLVADAAQDKRYPAALTTALEGTRSQCLLTHAQGPDLEAAAPHLITYPPFDPQAQSWQWLFGYCAQMPAAITVIASPLGFDELFAHLHAFTEVRLPDGEGMIFAFWDPAILAPLVGQRDDTTLHVHGPVLDQNEQKQFLSGVSAWWYWDRGGKMHRIVPDESPDATKAVALPLRLAQTQVDMLVEASVPDHILGHIRTSKPAILTPIPEHEQYASVRRYLKQARELKLTGMQDIVNYVCAGFIYGSQMQENSKIEALLGKVRAQQVSLTEALEQFP